MYSCPYIDCKYLQKRRGRSAGVPTILGWVAEGVVGDLEGYRRKTCFPTRIRVNLN